MTSLWKVLGFFLDVGKSLWSVLIWWFPEENANKEHNKTLQTRFRGHDKKMMTSRGRIPCGVMHQVTGHISFSPLPLVIKVFPHILRSSGFMNDLSQIQNPIVLSFMEPMLSRCGPNTITGNAHTTHKIKNSGLLF